VSEISNDNFKIYVVFGPIHVFEVMSDFEYAIPGKEILPYGDII
jgi:hypothetical protein